MNQAPPVKPGWKLLVIGWLVTLHATPYVVSSLAAGEFSKLIWIIWAMLSGPFAWIGILSFLTVAGAWPVMLRRLLCVGGSLALMGVLMTLFEADIIGASAWLGLQAIVIIMLTLLSCRFLAIPARPTRWSLQFSLAEIILLSGLAGVFLFMLRLAEATDFQFWSRTDNLVFLIFAIMSGVHQVPACLATIATTRRAAITWIVISLIMWGVIPLPLLAILAALNSQQLGADLAFTILYPVLGFQLLLVWGTLFPIRFAFPQVLFTKEAPPATAAQDTPGTLADDPQSYPHTEHTDAPD